MKGRGWEGPTKPRWSARGPLPWEKVITRSDLPQRDSPCLVKKSSLQLDPVFVTPDFKEARVLSEEEKFIGKKAFNDNCFVMLDIYEVNVYIVVMIIVKIIVIDRCVRINWKKSPYRWKITKRRFEIFENS